jgi:hypothetical protein
MVVDESPNILVALRDRKVTDRFAYSLQVAPMALVAHCVIALSLGTPVLSFGQNSPEHLLSAKPEVGQVRRVKSVLEVDGELKLNPDGKQVTRLPLKVRGDLLYTERILEFDAEESKRQDARYYQTAEAAIQVGETNHQNLLRDSLRLVVVDAGSEQTNLFSPLGPLTREELELVNIQGNSALLYRLLPNRKARVGETWHHENPVIAQLLGLDVVHTNGIESTLRKVGNGVAVIDIKGAVSGAVSGVSSDLELKGVYNFHIAERRVTWFAVSIKEDRAIGHARPGFEVTARLRILTASGKNAPELTREALTKLSLKAEPGTTLLEFRSEVGGFRFLHDRNWRLMVDRHDVAIMRRIDRGDLIAQCNISSLADLKPGQHLELETFQADVQRALSDKFGQFVEASRATTDAGLRILRAVVNGTVSDLPIQWTYYHFSNDSGRQLSLVFTMDVGLVERFAENDAVIVGSFAFQQRPEPEIVPRET